MAALSFLRSTFHLAPASVVARTTPPPEGADSALRACQRKAAPTSRGTLLADHIQGHTDTAVAAKDSKDKDLPEAPQL